MAAEYWDFSFSKWCSNAKKRFEWFQSGAVERHFENEINDESCVLEFGHHFEIKSYTIALRKYFEAKATANKSYIFELEDRFETKATATNRK